MALQSAHVMRVTNQSILFNDMPMDWITGLGFGLALVAITGATLVSLPPDISMKGEDTSFILQVIQEEQCTNAFLQPFILYDITLYQKMPWDLSKLKFCMTGGQPVAQKLLIDALNLLPQLNFSLSYGSSEDGLVAHSFLDKTTVQREDYNMMEIGPGIELMIQDDSGKLLPIGTTGEICRRGPNVFQRYLANTANQAKTVTGWFGSGDSGFLDGSGRLRVFGRMGDGIRCNGIYIFPVELEKFITKHPSVAKVAVVGVPDQRSNEEVCACIVLKQAKTEQATMVAVKSELEQWCKREIGSQFNIPVYHVKYFIYLDEFPCTRTGKPCRPRLKEMAAKELGLL